MTDRSWKKRWFRLTGRKVEDIPDGRMKAATNYPTCRSVREDAKSPASLKYKQTYRQRKMVRDYWRKVSRDADCHAESQRNS